MIKIYILLIIIVYFIIRTLYYNKKFKKESQYPCYRVVGQDGVMSKCMYYEDAVNCNNTWHGLIIIDKEEYNKLNKI